MKIKKRNGTIEEFNTQKIVIAISKANESVPEEERLTRARIQKIASEIERYFSTIKEIPSIERISDKVELEIMREGGARVAQNYIRYRENKALKRKANTTDDQILSLLELANEEMKMENANKNPIIASTQRDYMAGTVSKDLAQRILLPKDVVEAHQNGVIHFHNLIVA